MFWGFLRCFWAGGAEMKDKTAVGGSGIRSPSLCLHSLAFSDDEQAGACRLNCSGYCTRNCRLVERLQGASFSLRTVGLTPLV